MAKKKKKIPWDNRWYLKIHQLASDGLSMPQIATTIGIGYDRLRDLRSRDPAVRDAFEQAGATEKGSNEQSFFEYIHERLPSELRGLWDQLEAMDEAGNGIEMVEALFSRTGTHARQHLYIHALVARNFNASAACRMVGLSKPSIDAWMREPAFARLVDEMRWHKANFFESSLVQLIKRGDPGAIVFANRTFNKDRGYGDSLKVEHSGSIEHSHQVAIEDLGLPVEVLSQVFHAMKAARLAQEQTIEAAPLMIGP